jgi:GGDEF domain-containing protein
LKRARFARQPTALIVFDLDRFKSINDRYGHHTGDEVLTAFCRLAKLRPNDLFGRIGGEEFASLLPDTGHHAVWLAERGAGVAISEKERSDLNALLDAADRALYRAKALGRNRVEPSPLWSDEWSTAQRAVAI